MALDPVFGARHAIEDYLVKHANFKWSCACCIHCEWHWTLGSGYLPYCVVATRLDPCDRHARTFSVDEGKEGIRLFNLLEAHLDVSLKLHQGGFAQLPSHLINELVRAECLVPNYSYDNAGWRIESIEGP